MFRIITPISALLLLTACSDPHPFDFGTGGTTTGVSPITRREPRPMRPRKILVRWISALHRQTAQRPQRRRVRSFVLNRAMGPVEGLLPA